MKRAKLIHGLLGCLILAFSGMTEATLIDRGHGMVYDSAQDLTWLLDANAGAGSIYDDSVSSTDGLMTWGNATAWAASLTVGGYTDWRLPTVTDTGTPGCDFAISGTDCGYNIDTSGSEMGYMWYNILGNTVDCDTSGSCLANGSGPISTSADGVTFNNLQPYLYWSDTEYAPATYNAWSFFMNLGNQHFDDKGGVAFAWAVRSGDVPEPSTVLLLGAGLVGLLSRRLSQRT